MIRDELQQARKSRGLTMTQASEKAGITVQYWSMIENGQRTPSALIAGRMARVMGTDAPTLFTELR